MDRNTVKSLRELLDSVRDIDGFPMGKDEDILTLSDPPFYTACPNPYIKQFIEEYGKPYDPDNDGYDREPFVGDVSEGKNDPIYNAHSYHTKVPHKAIMKYIRHYTNPGDIVFDGFCGSGMTGIAAQILNRKAILSDLCPAATFIAYNYNTPVDAEEFEREAKRIIQEVEEECGWMYETRHSEGTYKEQMSFLEDGKRARINYTVWSDVFVCPYCKNEYVFWDVAVNKENGKIRKQYQCPLCDATITKRECQRATKKFFDGAIQKEVTQVKQVPVLINYSVGGKRYEKKPDKGDLALIEKIKNSEIPHWFPSEPMMQIGEKWGDTWRAGYHFGITHVHHFYTKRNLWVLALLYDKIMRIVDKNISFYLLWSFNSIQNYVNKKQSYGGGGGGVTGTLYVPSMISEKNVLQVFKRKINRILRLGVFSKKENVIISIQSMTDTKRILSNSIDYIFTDPPFASNLMYSELNFIWESWLKVFTNNKKEAIVNDTQNKGLAEYTELMSQCFREYYRILKPNRWITVVFHNSKASVWNAIQESITRAGFIIAQVAVLDKKQGSFKQVTSAGAVKNDLVINAYKPKTDFSKRFLKNAGEGMEIDFVIQQLEHLPVKPNIERTEKMFYSKMLAHYVENGFKIKYDSTNFYKLLSDNFVELDGYWFLDNQVEEYNKWKSGLSLEQIKDVLDGQQLLFVSDEKSALVWLYDFLHQPRTYSEIYTAYQKVATTTDDKIPELKELLDNNSIAEDGKYRRPISRKEREGINKNRERELDRTFQKLLKQAIEQKGRIRNVRREALIYGFTKCYQESRYQDILTVANKLYASTLEASGDIMDFVDIARIKTSGEEKKQRTIDNEFPLWR